MSINHARYESLKYVDLPTGLTATELEVVGGTEEDPSPRLSLRAPELGDKSFPLAITGFENLTEYLGVPAKFAKKLNKSKKSHVMAYLQRQLAGAWGGGVPLVAVVDQKTDEIVSITENSHLFFHGGSEIQDLDNRIHELCERENSTIKLIAVKDGCDGIIHYRFRQGEGTEVDPAADTSLWAWGLGFKHSPYGVAVPIIQTVWERLVCTNLTYRPEKAWNFTPKWADTFEGRWKSLEEFLLDPPEVQFGQLEGYLRRAQQIPASLLEVRTVRRQLKAFLKATDDEAASRIDAALRWPEIVEGYPEIFGPDAALKPSKKWLSAASTPVKLFDLYNYMTQEVSHAPADLDEKGERLSLLVEAGRLLIEVPDMQDVPRQVVW